MIRSKFIRRFTVGILAAAMMFNVGCSSASLRSDIGAESGIEQATTEAGTTGENDIEGGAEEITTEDLDNEAKEEEKETDKPCISTEEEAGESGTEAGGTEAFVTEGVTTEEITTEKITTEEVTTEEVSTEEAVTEQSSSEENDGGLIFIAPDDIPLTRATIVPNDSGVVGCSNPISSIGNVTVNLTTGTATTCQMIDFTYTDGEPGGPIYCIQPGVAIHTGNSMTAGQMISLCGLPEDLYHAMGFMTADCNIPGSMSLGEKYATLGKYWEYQCLIWHYMGSMSDDSARAAISTFDGSPTGALADYDRIKSLVAEYNTIPSYSVSDTGFLTGSQRYELTYDPASGSYTAILQDTSGMLSNGRMQTPIVYSGDTSATITFTQCDASGNANPSGEYMKIASNKALSQDTVIQQVKKSEYTPSGSNSIVLTNTSNGGANQDCVTIRAGSSSVSSYFTLYTVEEPVLQVKKVSTMDYGTSCRTYSLSGATYGIYTNPACTNLALAYEVDANGRRTGNTTSAYLVCNASGNTQSVSLAPGTYYVKETKAGEGFMIDLNTYRVVLSGNDVQVLTCQEVPVVDPVNIEVYKSDSEGIAMLLTGEDDSDVYKIGDATLEGAVFKVSYYDSYLTEYPDDSISATRTWYIETKYSENKSKYVARLDAEHLSDYAASDTFYYNETNTVSIPLGTIIIEEVQTPDGYLELNEAGVMTDVSGVLEHNYSIQQNRAVDTDGDGNADTAVRYVSNGGTDLSDNGIKVFVIPQGGTPLAVSEVIKRGDFHFTKKNYETEKIMPGVFFKVTSSAGEVHYICTDKDGAYDSNTTAHSKNTNGYDALFDTDGNYIGPKNIDAVLAMDCGLWFYGTSDTDAWDSENIDDTRGALRYDETYTIEEVSCPANEGLQLVSATFSITEEDTNVDCGTFYDTPVPVIGTLEWDADSETHYTVAGEENTIVDTCSYKYLSPNKTFTLKGVLLELDEEGNITGPLKDADGSIVQAEEVFKTGDVKDTRSDKTASGSVDVTYSFNGEGLSGKRFVIFEYLFEGSDETPLEVSKDGSVDESDVYTVHDEKIKHTDETEEDQIGIFTKDIDISKQSATTGTDIIGSTLSVYDEEGELIDSWVTDGKAHTVPNMKPGNYILVEERTAFGYVVAADVKFTVNANNEVQQVVMIDEEAVGQLIVKKVNPDGDALEGAEFVIKDEDGTIVDTLVTDKNGEAQSRELPAFVFDADGTYDRVYSYTLMETKAPDGYEMNDTEYPVTFEYVNDETGIIINYMDITNQPSPVPKTGDKALIVWVSGIAILAGAAFVIMQVWNRKKGTDKNKN